MNSLVIACLGTLAAGLWAAILLCPWRPWSTRETLDARGTGGTENVEDLTAVIPARNEAEVIGRSLRALREQSRNLRIVVVDDLSVDDTARVAREGANPPAEVVIGTPLPPAWSGKLWALEQGRRRVDTPMMLLLDADVELSPGILAAARTRLRAEDLDMVSVLAAPRMHSPWEKLLMPAYVYFFKLLYPFRLCRSPDSPVAAAAGGFVLLKARLLEGIGGFAAIKDELIDDCALARRVKLAGGRTWLGLSHDVRSLRANPKIIDLWNLIARTAFTQLRYSAGRLVLCTLTMILAFWIPVLALLHADAAVKRIGLLSLASMMLTYLPTLKFYRRSPAWASALPLIGTLCLAMTWGSAIQYWRGQRACWKGRVYRGEAA